MAIQPTYPGVYVQEVPSGVRTIVGVSTSTAMFIGRAKKGPLNTPILCLSYSDFDRNFTSEDAGSELPLAVRLFFQNGGTTCYVVRIAEDAEAASVELLSEGAAPSPVLRVTARSPGLIGNSIRLAVTYNGLHPESTFNLEVFRLETNNAGQQIKVDVEKFDALSMDSDSARYAPLLVNQASNIVELTDIATIALGSGYSQSGRPIGGASNPNLRSEMRALFGADAGVETNQFRISVDGEAAINVDLSGIDFSGLNPNNVPGLIEGIINPMLPGGSSVDVTLAAGSGPTGPGVRSQSRYLRFSSANGDVRIEPAAQNDLAQLLMLGSAQGGLEVSRYAARRPAANGIVFDLQGTNLNDFASLLQTAFNDLEVGTAPPISLNNALVTNTNEPSPPMYYDAGFDTPIPNAVPTYGILEKWNIIADAINGERLSNPAFRWSAQIWGNRLALIPGEGGENTQSTFATSGGTGTNIGNGGMGLFYENVRYYSLGSFGTGSFQTSGTAGADGNAPTLAEYRAAFLNIEREVDLFNLLILPKDDEHTAATTAALWGPASTFCQEQRAFLLMDPPEAWQDHTDATNVSSGVNSLRIGLVKDHSAIFFPRLSLRNNGLNVPVGPAGAIAGLMARIDSSRGVWKAPAGTEATIRGVTGVVRRFSDRENGVMNPRGVNTIRIFPNGIVNWGARTMDGDDDFASEWKYIPVRRTALFIEESLYRGLKWVLFEPNDEPLWAQIRLNVGAFMHNLFRQGAFQGTTKDEAYFVKCDSETTTQNDVNLGIVNVWVGFAPLKPAEFVILYLQQMTGQVQV